MSSFASFIFLFLFFFLICFRASPQDPLYVHNFCPNTTTYSTNSTYSTNLRILFSSLTSRIASYSTGFQNATVGQAPDRVTGLFLCRGDVSPEVCSNCIAFSINESLTRCPNQREVVLYYDECMLRYSNRNILSTLKTDGGHTMASINNIPPNQQDRFRDLVLSTMNQASTEAEASSRKLGASKANFFELQSVYGLVQCTPDLTTPDCKLCLQTTINQLPTDKIGGRLVLPSCSSRFELYAFYNETAVPPSSPESPPRRSESPPRHSEGGISILLVVAIVVTTIVVVLLFIAGYCLLAKRSNNTYGFWYNICIRWR